ncbi:Hsp20/alpha crystallin family protein [Fibrella forsythiae]|uniref:Hsp20/alpha crystallin family protein n=1 Tax=Fibrella forsythiae TaxID=2817061 RepID=A0ABS3JGE6_9BACT|nr:Hsp20/alpha crystallin family protein [Fibrella forsythiae]MBO0949055.1 Hsp20/alpha crystallin family protein [Fibrella forsythiae]
MNTLARVNSMPTLFDTFFGPSYATRPYITRYAKPTVSTPAVNVKDTENAYLIDVAAPGAKKENFSLSVNQQVLTLTFKNEEKAEETKDAYVRHEFNFQSFERSFRLPKTVNVEAIKATYTDGILTVELPKMEEPKPEVKQIEIA